jgi:RimJ/RimL family protein N-acetyltransferase
MGLFEDGDVAPEVGYWIGRPYWGRGYATEALEAGVIWASRNWRRRALVAGHFEDNPASGRVLEKAGFLYTGEVRKGFSRARNGEARTRRMVWLA